MSESHIRRLCLPDFSPGKNTLLKEDAHYLRRVLRLRPGHPLTVFDGEGLEAEATLIGFIKNGAEIEVGEALRREPPTPKITLAVGAPKGERADFLIEKATELGVHTLVFVDFARTVTRLDPDSERFKRFERISRAAATQCGRADLLQIKAPISFQELLQLPDPLRLVAAPAGAPIQSISLQEESLTIAIGPEGGFIQEEELAMREAAFKNFALAPYILRTETAAIAATALITALSIQNGSLH
ncbi:16S rRNA (uracil(1498)-N(3))-methyltransferase [Myxococcota bacterium]|nr:16S rRNA (uracil(1498)-N(3))-methyltransferase [Myxococcota bacterium]